MHSRKQLRAKERGLEWLCEKLRRQGASLEDRIKILDQAEREGWQEPPKVARRFKPEERAALIARARLMRANGASIKQVAARFGIARDTAETWCSGVKCPVNHRPKGNPGWRRRTVEVRHAA